MPPHGVAVDVLMCEITFFCDNFHRICANTIVRAKMISKFEIEKTESFLSVQAKGCGPDNPLRERFGGAIYDVIHPPPE